MSNMPKNAGRCYNYTIIQAKASFFIYGHVKIAVHYEKKLIKLQAL